MESIDNGERWRQIATAREEFENVAVLPAGLLSRIDGKPLQISPRTQSFAQALAFSDGWASITAARNRRTDLAA